jgi:hypothetical protein
MRKQTQEHKNIVSKLASLEKKIASIEKGQLDKKMMAQNFKRIGDLEKKVESLEAELKKCCTKSAATSRSSSKASSRASSKASSRASSKANSTRSSRTSSRGSQPRTRRQRRGLSFDSNDTYDSDVSYTSDQERRMYMAQV